MLIDRLAYMSKLKDSDPLLKTLFALVCLCICLWANSFVISAVTAALMLSITVFAGGTKWKDVRRLLTVPASFIIVGSAAIALAVGGSDAGMAAHFHIGGVFIGIAEGGILSALRVAAKCFGCVSCMYFLSLSTPMSDLFGLLRRSVIPNFIVEITELVYRYIFVLYDAADRIRTAQASRLGYCTLKSSYRSTGILAANIFMRAYRQAEKTYTAMEARGYRGEINLIGREYKKNGAETAAAAVLAALMAVLAVICKKYGV